MLQKVSSYGGNFHVYEDIARLPPLQLQAPLEVPTDAIDAALHETLQRYPPFPALKRVRPGVFLFGRYEIECTLPQGGGVLVAATHNG